MNEVFEGGNAPLAMQNIAGGGAGIGGWSVGGIGAGAGCRGTFNRNDSVDTAGSIGNASLGVAGTQHLLGVPKNDSPGLLAVPSGGYNSQLHHANCLLLSELI